MNGNRADRTTLADVLSDTTCARTQSVGVMQVIPLVSTQVDDGYVSPAEPRVRVSTCSYGTLAFENPSDAVLIVPCHAAYILRQAAQDHAMAHTGLVGRRATRAFDTAMCIQQTQGGLIRGGEYQMTILPLPLRAAALAVRHAQNFGRLWPAICQFNETTGVGGGGHLCYFFQRFRRELNEFVAEFECVPGQVGAIVLVNGAVVGIERVPSQAYWNSVWSPLIRDCYGSLALTVARSGGEPRPPNTRVPLPDKVGALTELADALKAAAAEEDRRIHGIVNEVCARPVRKQTDERLDGLALETLTEERFIGQAIRTDGRVVYASIVASRPRTLRLTPSKAGRASPT